MEALREPSNWCRVSSLSSKTHTWKQPLIFEAPRPPSNPNQEGVSQEMATPPYGSQRPRQGARGGPQAGLRGQRGGCPRGRPAGLLRAGDGCDDLGGAADTVTGALGPRNNLCPEAAQVWRGGDLIDKMCLEKVGGTLQILSMGGGIPNVGGPSSAAKWLPKPCGIAFRSGTGSNQ